jgi:hypothetical protein
MISIAHTPRLPGPWCTIDCDAAALKFDCR